MKDVLSSLIITILQDLGVPNPEVEVTVPEDPSHGDYTTNVAMTLAKTLKKSPMDIALQVKERITYHASRITKEVPDHNIGKRGQKTSEKVSDKDILSAIDHVEVASPGFLNVFVTEASLITQVEHLLKSAESVSSVSLRAKRSNLMQKGIAAVAGDGSLAMTKKKIMVEFAHPNTHKAFHIGHLRNITTGESIIRLLESQGNTVIRANYQGDVGMHIAKCLYSLLHQPHETYKTHVTHASLHEKVEFLGKAYAAGSKAFEEDAKAKEEIVSLNALVYAAAQRLAKERGIDPGTTDYLALVKPEYVGRLDEVYTLWKETRQWSLDYFETVYKRVGSHYDRYYFESECLAGVDLSRDALKKGVLKKDAGAIIFDGKPYGVDTRVFVNSLGLPTYEGKELALATMETTEHGKLDRMIHVVGPEQASFFIVTFKAEELLGIVRPGVQHHLIYGWVKLKHGKMSSRSGNVVLGEWLLDEAKKSIYNILQRNTSKDKSLDTSDSRDALDPSQRELIAEKAAVAAVKYAFLKVGTTQEIAFDLQTSVSFDGDSGPYLQYTYARCRSVLRKAGDDVIARSPASRDDEAISKKKGIAAVAEDGSLAMTLNPEERSLARLLTHFPDVVAEAADTLSPSTLCTYLFRLAQSYNLFYAKHPILGAPLRLALTAASAQVLKTGLYLLGIETLEQM